MDKISNSILLKSVLSAIYNVASRRTSTKFADETIGSTIKTLEGKYDFLKFVEINPKGVIDGDFAISVSPLIDSINPEVMGKAIEALIRVAYNDLSAEAGLYFVTELKELAGDDISRAILYTEADLDQVQLEQHYAYRRRERKKAISEATRGGISSLRKPENLIGYGWGEVFHWKHDSGSKYCTLYDKQGNVLDRLNLDRIIQNYVERLSGYIDVDPRKIEKDASLYEKEYDLLKLLLERDMDAETAMVQLHVTREELNNMIRKLSQMEMLTYIDFNTLELTDVGIGYLTKKDKKK
ncbi:MAG: hypothetical protein KAS76_00140 [Thermoplasmatales archaeon]|nr:hypothetical protein [Thermoplasmatales archaeon]